MGLIGKISAILAVLSLSCLYVTSRGRDLEGSSWSIEGKSKGRDINMGVFSTQVESGTMDMEEITRRVRRSKTQGP